jgi:lipopolysaccharide export system permease protein
MIFQRYLGRSIIQSTTFVLIGFLSMFLFFDFLAELDEVGSGGYKFQYAVGYILLGLPARIVELAPIAALIGTLWALSQSAANSEFTVFRVSGLMPGRAIATMLKIGLPMILVTALFSEVIAPLSEDFRARVKEGSLSSSSGVLRSGLWLRDSAELPEGAGAGTEKAIRFVNLGKFTPEQIVERVLIYDFDARQRLAQTLTAANARYLGQQDDLHRWELIDVTQVIYGVDGAVRQNKLKTIVLGSVVSPEMVNALVTNPDRMSSIDLYQYVQYLKRNKQQSERYEIALWKRVVYPFVIWVMMLLALPAAYLQARAGAVGARVFAGILVGVGFHLLNSLFSHLGVLNTWPAPIMALLPSAMALLVAGFFFYWVQYR